jgi:hypothetical protein
LTWQQCAQTGVAPGLNASPEMPFREEFGCAAVWPGNRADTREFSTQGDATGLIASCNVHSLTIRHRTANEPRRDRAMRRVAREAGKARRGALAAA